MLLRPLRHIRNNLVAYIALFVALSGTSYAAFSLPAGSVGTRELKNARNHGGEAEPDERRGERAGVGDSDAGPAAGGYRRQAATFT